MAQVENNTKEQAMKSQFARGRGAVIVSAMQSHQNMAQKLLSDEATRGVPGCGVRLAQAGWWR